MHGVGEIICATVFAPADPVVDAYMFNCYGDEPGDQVGVSGVGEYYIGTSGAQGIGTGASEVRKISVNARAYNATGDLRIVTVSQTNPADNTAGPVSGFNILIKEADGTPTDDFLFCEVTVSRLPLA